MHARYMQGMSLPSVGWGGQDKSLPETHQHPFALLPVHLVRGRRQATQKSHISMSLEAKMPAAGVKKGTSILPTACCWRGHPPGRLSSLAMWPMHQPLCGQGSPACAGGLSGHQYLQGCCVTSYGHPNYNASNAQRGNQSHSVGRHEKCQAGASSHS